MHAQALAMLANFAQYRLREVCAAGLIVGMKCQAPLHRYRSHQQHRKSTPKRKNMLRILIGQKKKKDIQICGSAMECEEINQIMQQNIWEASSFVRSWFGLLTSQRTVLLEP